MRRHILMQKLDDMDRRGVWAFTPATFSALLGDPEPNYLKLRMKRLADQGVLIRAARGVYVNPHARFMPNDVRRAHLLPASPRAHLCEPGVKVVRGGSDLAGRDRLDLHDHGLFRPFRYAPGERSNSPIRIARSRSGPTCI